MDNKAYALKSTNPPKIIIWDEKWPDEAGIIEPNFKYALGVTPKKLIDKPNFCPILIRPELRLFKGENQLYSSIVEFTFEVDMIPSVTMIPEILFGAIELFVHPSYSQEFAFRTHRDLSLIFDLQENKDEILETASKTLKDAGW